MIKDDNKVLLLTIFLYIALNIRKIERLIQCVNNNESFTISTKVNNTNILALTITKICTIFIALIFARNYYPEGILGLNNLPSIIILLLLVLFGVLLFASIALETANEDWAQTLDIITNEICYGLVIYFILSNLLLNQVDNIITNENRDDIVKFIANQLKDKDDTTTTGDK